MSDAFSTTGNTLFGFIEGWCRHSILCLSKTADETTDSCIQQVQTPLSFKRQQQKINLGLKFNLSSILNCRVHKIFYLT